jgi:hypothetical protein
MAMKLRGGILGLLLMGGLILASCGTTEDQEEPQENGKQAETQIDSQLPQHQHLPPGSGLVRNDSAFVSEAGRFSVSFPDTPEHSMERTPSEYGDILTHMYILEDLNNGTYLLSYSDIPLPLLEASGKDAVLAGAKNGVLATIGAVLSDEERLDTLSGYPGIYFRAHSGTNFTIYKIYLVGDRLYQLGVLWQGKYPEEAIPLHFLSSFTLIEPDQNG